MGNLWGIYNAVAEYLWSNDMAFMGHLWSSYGVLTGQL